MAWKEAGVVSGVSSGQRPNWGYQDVKEMSSLTTGCKVLPMVFSPIIPEVSGKS